MNDTLPLVLTSVAAYLIGAIPFGYLVARWRGIDIFKEGSGNIGATNVGRVLGRKFGILVFCLDFLKGAFPTLLALLYSHLHKPDLPPDSLAVAAGMMAFLGHLFPIYLRFRGGKGVATSAGVVMVLLPLPGLVALLTWLVVVGSSLYVSLASLTAAVALCAVRFLSLPNPFDNDSLVLSLFCLFASGMVFVRHQSNLRRLLKGNENRLKDSSTMNTFARILHVLAVGLWFGMAVFFTFVVAFSLFGTFEKLAEDTKRPLWFPLPSAYDKGRPSEKFPDPLRKEQGTRAAGYAIGPLFDWYFLLQTGCALVALVPALTWRRSGRRLDRWRVVVLVLALVGVLAGWRMEVMVHELGGPRNILTDEVLRTESPIAELIQSAEKARSQFGMWHGMSMLLNVLTLGLVFVAMAMTARLPEEKQQRQEGPR